VSVFDWGAFGAAFFILGRWYESQKVGEHEIIYDKDTNQYLIPAGIRIKFGKINQPKG